MLWCHVNMAGTAGAYTKPWNLSGIEWMESWTDIEAQAGRRHILDYPARPLAKLVICRYDSSRCELMSKQVQAIHDAYQTSSKPQESE